MSDPEYIPSRRLTAPAKEGQLLPKQPAGLIRADGVIFPYTEELARLPSMKPLDKLPGVPEMLAMSRDNAMLRIRLRHERAARRGGGEEVQQIVAEDKQIKEVIRGVQDLPARKFGLPIRKWVLKGLNLLLGKEKDDYA